MKEFFFVRRGSKVVDSSKVKVESVNLKTKYEHLKTHLDVE